MYRPRVFRIPLLWAVLLAVFTAPIVAQEDTVDPLQPDVELILIADRDALAADQQRSIDLVFSAVEAAFRVQRRYDLSRRSVSESVDEPDGPAAVVRVVTRNDGSLGVETDVWDGAGYVASEVYDLPVDDQRFSAAEEIAATLVEQMAGIFPGFGRLRFSNNGFAAPFYVYIDDSYLGAGIDEIDLPTGRYTVEIRRRDDGFEQVVGRVPVQLGEDDFVDVRFSMDRQPPPVPGYLRLMNPEDRWRALLDLRGSYLIPTGGNDYFDATIPVAGFATALFNDVGIRGFVVGFEAGHIYSSGVDPLSDGAVTVEATPLFGVLGLTVGPVSGVDLVIRGGGGMALTRSTVEFDDGSGVLSTFAADGYAPAITGTMEFGFGLWGNSRLSLHASWIGIVEDGELFPWIAVGLGFGGRF